MKNLTNLCDMEVVETRVGSTLLVVPSREELEIELADARLLQELSTQMIQEDGMAGLYKKIVEAAVKIMRSQYGTIQMLYPDPPNVGKLKILASSGLSPEADQYWEWVYQSTGSTCGEVLRTGKQCIVADYQSCEWMQDQPTLPVFVKEGILSAQSTPLYSREGRLLGMITTHWRYPHNPPENHLRLLDILARLAADLIERTQHEEALKVREQQLKDIASLLEQRVEERTREMQRSNEDLLQFAHVASHDLKEPVRKILTFGGMLKSQLNGKATPSMSLQLDKMLQSAARMTTMIDGVLKYSSFNGTDPVIDKLSLNKIINEVLTDLDLKIQEKNAEVIVNELPAIEGIEVLIYQLFYNLINNALKFARAEAAPQITIAAIANNTTVTIEIKDNGIGFNEKYKDSIFNTFTRLHSKDQYDGTGLGLSLAKKIAERHGGSISAEGKENLGATFTITLPLSH